MATERTKLIRGIVIGALGLGIIGGIIIWLLRDKCDPNRKGYTKKGKISDKCFGREAEEKDKADTTPPSSAGCSKWIPDDTFPLKKCMKGNKIRALQTGLGFTGEKVDGKFGTIDTLPAVQNKFGGRSEVTEAEYNLLTNPPVELAIKKGEIAYAKTDMNLYKSKSATTANIYKHVLKGTRLGVAVEVESFWVKIYELTETSEGNYYARKTDLTNKNV